MSRPCVGDWMGLRIGQLVTANQGRHIGRIESIKHSARVKVRWFDPYVKLVEYFDLDEVEPISPAHALWLMFHPD